MDTNSYIGVEPCETPQLILLSPAQNHTGTKVNAVSRRPEVCHAFDNWACYSNFSNDFTVTGTVNKGL